MKKSLLFFISLLATFCNHAEAQNLVTNGDFEELSSSKDTLNFKYMKGWRKNTKVDAPLFYSTLQGGIESLEAVKTSEKSYSGQRFTGITTYSFLGLEPRSYLANYLDKPVRKGEHYCLKMHLMLHPRAKYHTTDLGVIATKSDIADEYSVLLLDEEAVKFTFPENFSPGEWVEVFAGFTALENGQYLNIGNFESDSQTEFSELPKNEKSALAGQIPLAFYYLDNVQLSQVGKVEDCPVFVPNVGSDAVANNNQSPQRNVVQKDDFSRLPPLPEQNKPERRQNIEPERADDPAFKKAVTDDNTIVFLDYSSGLNNDLYDDIDRVIDNFKEGQFKALTIVARTSYDEAYAASLNRNLRSLSSKRLRNVKDYILRKGVQEEKLQLVEEPYNAAKLQGGSPTVSFVFVE